MVLAQTPIKNVERYLLFPKPHITARPLSGRLCGPMAVEWQHCSKADDQIKKEKNKENRLPNVVC